MGLFDNIRQEILEEFSSYTGASNFVYESFDKDGKPTCCFFTKRNEPINSKNASSLVQLLEEKRWGFEITCVKCYHNKCYELMNREAYRCGKCGRDFNVFTDTLLSGAKLPISVYYDTVEAFRKNNSVSSRQLSRDLGYTQKTMWHLLAKIKMTPLAYENDIPILSVLLQPHIQNKAIPKTKLSYPEWEKIAKQKVKDAYKGTNARFLPTMDNLFYVLKTFYDGKCNALAFDMGIEPTTLSKYLTGTRSIKQIHSGIAYFINKKVMEAHKKNQTALEYLN